ncbi:hypothetical protein AGMMS49975_26720 [Clostridia bacterium]|nr:hypothetical protein AGMMS49975_26720 [Clostridia bacterium]
MNSYIGTEPFFYEQDQSVAQVNDFWRWSGSDLLDNTYRGMLAEFLVARALNLNSITRAGWGLYDLLYGDIKIEVKSSAYIQSWEQKQPYAPRFDIHEAVSAGKRPSDIYVFSLLNEKEREVVNPLDLRQWDFYVVKTSVIDLTFDKQKSVGLSMIEPIALCVKFDGLKQAVDMAGGTL